MQLKKWLPVISLMLILLPAVLYAQSQPSREELERRKRELQREMDEAQARLQETKKSSKESLSQLRALRNKINVRSRMISNINEEINFINGDINAALRDVKNLQKDLDTLKAQYAELVVYAYKNRSSYAMINFVFSANSFNDAVKRFQYLRQYREFRRRQADNIQVTQDQLKLKVKNLEGQRVLRASTLKTEQEQRSILEKDRKEKDNVVQKLKGREKEILSEIAQKKKDQKKVQDAIRAVIRKEIEDARKKAAAEELARKKAAEAERKRREEALATAKEAAKANNTANINTPPPTAEPAAKPARNYNILEATPEAAALSENFEANRGRLPWPIETGSIIGNFGKQKNADMERIVEENDGIIFATRKGGSVKAVFEGEIRKVFSVPGAGYVVMIRHGQYFTNYVGLQHVTVRSGDKVSTGQVIGTARTNEDENAGVVEVQVFKGGVLQNANLWLKSR